MVDDAIVAEASIVLGSELFVTIYKVGSEIVKCNEMSIKVRKLLCNSNF